MGKAERAEKRRKEREKKSVTLDMTRNNEKSFINHYVKSGYMTTYTITKKQLQAIIEEETYKEKHKLAEDVKKNVVEDLCALFDHCVNDTKGIGVKKKKELMEMFYQELKFINQGEITIEDVKEMNKDNKIKIAKE